MAMPGAIFLSLVATFDLATADLPRLLLRLRPEKYNSSSKTIMIKDLLSMNSFDDAIEKVIEDEVEAVMRDTMTSKLDLLRSISASRSEIITTSIATLLKYSSGVTW